MWQYRGLIRNLTIAELKNRYQNTSVGFFWSILGPFLLAIVLYVVFKNLFKQEENFAVNLIVGIMAWRFFANGTMSSLSSIVSKPSLVTKVYIPREILTLSTVLSNLICSTLEFVVLLPIIFVLVGKMPVTVLLLPVLHLLYFWLVLGGGLFLAALYVYFRDLSQIWEVLLNILMFCSPIIYPLSTVPPHLKTYYMLNPLTRLVIMYRDVMVAGKLPSLSDFGIVIGFGALVFLVGSFTFAKLQRRFAEAI
jgi:lipopolysaccharide transport system permease protein